MAGRTGGIWRRLRYLNKWRSIRDALSPNQSAEADAAPETRARFAWRKSPFAVPVPEIASSRPEVATEKSGVALEVFGVEFSKPEVASPKPEVAKPGPKVASRKKRKRSESGKPSTPVKAVDVKRPASSSRKKKRQA